MQVVGGGALRLRMMDRCWKVVRMLLLLLDLLRTVILRVLLLDGRRLIGTWSTLLEDWVGVSIVGVLREASGGDEIGLFAMTCDQERVSHTQRARIAGSIAGIGRVAKRPQVQATVLFLWITYLDSSVLARVVVPGDKCPVVVDLVSTTWRRVVLAGLRRSVLVILDYAPE